jgi:hypothetical protein
MPQRCLGGSPMAAADPIGHKKHRESVLELRVHGDVLRWRGTKGRQSHAALQLIPPFPALPPHPSAHPAIMSETRDVASHPTLRAEQAEGRSTGPFGKIKDALGLGGATESKAVTEVHESTQVTKEKTVGPGTPARVNPVCAPSEVSACSCWHTCRPGPGCICQAVGCLRLGIGYGATCPSLLPLPSQPAHSPYVPAAIAGDRKPMEGG